MALDMKAKIAELVEKIKKNPALLKKFNTEPVKVVEELVGIDLPDELIEKLVDGVKAKITIDNVGDALGALGGLLQEVNKKGRLSPSFFMGCRSFTPMILHRESAFAHRPDLPAVVASFAHSRHNHKAYSAHPLAAYWQMPQRLLDRQQNYLPILGRSYLLPQSVGVSPAGKHRIEPLETLTCNT